MEIKGRKIMVLGGAGLVGKVICRLILDEHPEVLVISSLKRTREKRAVNDLKKEFPRAKIHVEWGDIFNLTSFADVVEPLNQKILEKSLLYNLLLKYEPEIIIDTINTATNIAYKDTYQSAKDLYKIKEALQQSQKLPPTQIENKINNHLASLDLPHLIRHVQILYEAIRKNPKKKKYKQGAAMYIKVGTSGIGGMGLNIPYTHGEERPSALLLAKASVAGAHSMLLFLMARTPDVPIIKEIKPATAIAWGEIGYGAIRVLDKPIQLWDCPPEAAYKLKGALDLKTNPKAKRLNNQKLKSIYIDNGESGLYALEEFKALTSYKQMEYLTPEEVAENVLKEIKGINTSTDIIAALDNTVMGPSYRAGILRPAVISRMENLQAKKRVSSVAFETLGPPRTSKLLFEVYLLKKEFKTIKKVAETKPTIISKRLESLVKGSPSIRSQIISVGIPILLSDGTTLLCGNQIKVPSKRPQPVRISERKINRWAMRGWVDLRISNMTLWQKRFLSLILKIQEQRNDRESSFTAKTFLRDDTWRPDYTIDIGETVGFILNEEEKGWRVK